MQNVASVAVAILFVGGGALAAAHAFSSPFTRRRAPTTGPVHAPEGPGQRDVPEPADAPNA